MAQPALNAVVAARTELSPRQIILRIVPDGWPLPAFEPGQFAVLGLPGSAPRCSWSDPERTPAASGAWIRRAYSIASSSRVVEYMEFYFGLVSDGALTPRIFALQLGGRIWLSRKVAGIFTLDRVAPDRNMVLIATGTGLAPYISMLRTEMNCTIKRRIVVLHGAYHSWDLGYRDELQTLDSLFENFSYFSAIDDPGREPVPWSGKTGRVQGLWKDLRAGRLADFHPVPENTDVFLCGNPDMIREMMDLLTAAGFREAAGRKRGEIHVERY